MKQLLFSILLLLTNIIYSQIYFSGHSAIEYNDILQPGLSIKNLNNSFVTSGRISVYNDKNYRLDFGVRSSTFVEGPNHTYIQSWNKSPLDFYTDFEKRMSLDSMGRFTITGDDLLQDTIVRIRTRLNHVVDQVGLSVIINPFGASNKWGIGGDFEGGWIGLNGHSNTGIGISGKSYSGTGVYGMSNAEIGVDGKSSDSIGVRGISTNYHGVVGHARKEQKAGVYGDNENALGWGVLGRSVAVAGVRGESGGGAGVYGLSNNGYGIQGKSTLFHGVSGATDNPTKFDFKADGAGMDYGAGSSRRWKSNIVNIANPLEKISLLRGVRYDWDIEHGGGRHDIGFIAEEIGEVLPEIVIYEDNGIDAIAMDYTKISALIVEAFNELKKNYDLKFQEQEAEINSLKVILTKWSERF
ncbi:MAG: tail fiber domain-containing protein [Saprospiraceae bacterium]